MFSFEEKELEIGGVRTVVRVAGEGKPVIFLHGASTLEGFDCMNGLAERFRVYCPYHPGFGASGDAPHVVGMTDFVLHYINLLDALELGGLPHVIGSSMGGWLVVEMVALARERFDKIVFVAPAGLNDPAYPPLNFETATPPDLPGLLSHDPTVAIAIFLTEPTKMRNGSSTRTA